MGFRNPITTAADPVARKAAADAQISANTAQATAAAAQTAANTAQTSADAAKTAANGAQSTADAAKTAAATAQTSADAAKTAAATAQTAGTNAQTTANQARTDAANAYTQASTGIVDGSRLAAATVAADRLVANTITANQLAAGAVTTAKLVAGAITANELATGAVTTAKLTAGAITANELATGAVTTVKLVAGAVTVNELAAGAVTTAKLTAGAVTANELAAGAVTADRLAANAIDGKTITGAIVQTAKTGLRWILSGADAARLNGYTGDSAEQAPGQFAVGFSPGDTSINGDRGYFSLAPPVVGAGYVAGQPALTVLGRTRDGTDPGSWRLDGVGEFTGPVNFDAAVNGSDTTWRVVGATGQPAYANGWTTYNTGFGPAKFRKLSSGLVEVTGVVAGGTISTTLPVFTLPLGYRPAAQIPPQAIQSNNALGRVDVTPDGKVCVSIGSNIWASLHLNFYAG